MPLSPEDKAEIAALMAEKLAEQTKEVNATVNRAVTARLDRYEADKKAAPPAQAEPEKAATKEGRLEKVEAEIAHWKSKAEAAEKAARAQREDGEFAAAWGVGLDNGRVTFVPGLSKAHLAQLRLDGRIYTDEKGVVRVKDPGLSEFDTPPTPAEYLAKLAKSDEGKLYMAPTGAAGAKSKDARARGSDLPAGEMTERQAWAGLASFAGGGAPAADE